MKLLLSIDGSANALRAARYVVGLAPQFKQVQIHLLNVQMSVPGDVKMFIGSAELKSYHREQALNELRGARGVFDEANLAYEFHIGVGQVAETIAQFVKEKNYDLIVMGTRGQSALSSLLLGSVTKAVIQLSPVPVMLIK